MDGTVNEGYFSWLCSLTEAPSTRNLARSYWSLLSQLHTKPFEWRVPNDDDRGEDGKELREEFLTVFDVYEVDHQWLEYDASMLEMLIALSRRTSYNSYGTSAAWFWKFLENLGLVKYTDAVYTPHIAEEVNAVLDNLIDRRYGFDGQGGIFPLRRPHADQRKIEIGYQMSTYLLEGNAVANGP